MHRLTDTRRSIGWLAALAIAGLMLAQPASARLKQAVWTGTISSGFDTKGIFGAPNTDLAGASYTSVYRYDTAVGNRAITPDYDSLWGGSAYGVPSPVSVANITINGHRYDFTLGQNDNVYTYPVSIYGIAHQVSAYYDVSGETRADYMRNDGLFPAYTNLDDNLPLSLVPAGYPSSPSDRKMFINGPIWYPYSPNDAFAQFDGDAWLAISDVPEPASWAMMTIGFGFAGAALRRRRRPAPPQVAAAQAGAKRARRPSLYTTRASNNAA